MPHPLDSPLEPVRRAASGQALGPAFSLACALTLLLCGCAAPSPAPRPRAEPVPLHEQAAAAPAPSPVSSPVAPPAPSALLTVLAYADRLRALPAAELPAEAEPLRQRQGALAWLQLALLHAQMQAPELARAQDLATQAQNDGSPEGQALQPLARLLASRFAEQRRSEEQLERQNKQLAELQKKLDQSLERLEALKAIERSLGKRLPGRAAEPSVP